MTRRKAVSPKWYRNQRGKVIHKPDCRHAASGVRWVWAERHLLNDEDLRLLVARQYVPWLQLCKVCW